jgi:hypothetical protein
MINSGGFEPEKMTTEFRPLESRMERKRDKAIRAAASSELAIGIFKSSSRKTFVETLINVR